MRSAKRPTLPRAAARSRDWVSAAATVSGGVPASRSRAPRPRAVAGSYGGSASSRAQPSGRSTGVTSSAALMPVSLPARGHLPDAAQGPRPSGWTWHSG